MSNRNREDRFVRQSNGLRVIRGMVFWYNVDASVKKDSDPKVWVKGESHRDHKQYGERDWLVVSNDIGNLTSPTCTIVPITSKKFDKSYIPTHVPFYFDGMHLTVLCEHVMTVNTCELQEFRYVLQDSVMDKVSEALRVQFQIPEYKNSSSEMYSIKKIEEIIENIVRNKVEKYKIDASKKVNLDDAIIRIGEGLESLFKSEMENAHDVSDRDFDSPDDGGEEKTENPVAKPFEYHDYTKDDDSTDKQPKPVKTKDNGNSHKSQTDKFYSKYPSLRPNTANTDSTSKLSDDTHNEKEAVKTDKTPKRRKKSGTRVNRKWDESTIKEFMSDMDKLPPLEVASKWGYKSVSDLYKVKYYLQSKLNKMSNQE